MHSAFDPASPQARQIAHLWWSMFGVGGAVWLAVIVAMFVVYLTPLSLLPALFVWSWPDWRTLAALVGLGGIGTLAHISVARAYTAADASACAPYEFVRLPYAALIGYLLFGELTDTWTWIGAAIIVAASMYVAYREAHVSQHGRKEAATPAAAC